MSTPRMQNDPGQGATLMEALEPRLLLSGTVWTGMDVDGDQLTVKLSGSGTLAVTGGSNSAIGTITVNSGVATNVLSVAVKKAPAGNGLIDVGKMDILGNLKAIKAPKARINGDAGHIGVTSPDWVGALDLYSIGAQTIVTIGPSGIPLVAPIRVTLAESAYLNSSMTFSSPISSFKAHDVLGSITSLSDIGSIKVADTMMGAITSSGEIGSISAFDGYGTWHAEGDIGKVKLKGSACTTLRVTTPGNIGAITFAGPEAQPALISARNLGSLKVSGNLTVSFGINLAGDAPDQICLRNLTVKGWWSGGFLRAHGSIGTVKIGGIGNARIFAGVQNSYPNYMGDNHASAVLESVGGALSTAYIKSVVVTGKATDPSDPSHEWNVSHPTIAASSLLSVRLAKVDAAKDPNATILALTLGKIVAKDINGDTYTYGQNWPAGNMQVIQLV